MVSPIRLSGLASGLDTETMVKDLMKAHRAPLHKLLQKKQLEEWKRDSYREINALLLDLRNKVFDMKLQGTYAKYKVTSSNESVVTARATGSHTSSTLQISVTQLAEVSSSISTDPISGDSGKINPDAKLETEQSKFKNASSGFGSSFKIKVFQPDGTFKEEEFTIDPANESLNDVLKKVNNSSLGITLFYDAASDKVSMSTNHTGDNTDPVNGAEIQITGGTFLTDVLHLEDADSGKNAQFTLNGLPTERTSNTFTINGMEYTLKSKGNATVTATADVDAIFNTIKGFVDKYNEVIAKINSKVKEKRYRDYQPLLDEQKQEMSEKQIELWEEKAKSGLLRSDSILTSTLYEMRRALSTNVSGASDPKFDSLSEIGITTGSYMEDGKLYIDETKLRNAISQNGSKVVELFTRTSSATNAEANFNESGIAQRLYNQLVNTMKKITEQAGSSGSLSDNSLLGKSINSIEEEIDRWEDRLAGIEDRYWRQFTAMEQALQRANSQSAWLMQQFGGGQ